VTDRNAGLIADPLFVGATRPPMRWGVTYAALLFNLVFTLEAFLVTRNLLTLLLFAPIHGLCALLCARDARFFALIRTQGFWPHIEHLAEPCHGVVRWAGGDARREP
jgi:type IV secretion system protein VirB3